MYHPHRRRRVADSLILVKHPPAVRAQVYSVPSLPSELQVSERHPPSARLQHRLLELQQVSLQAKTLVLYRLIRLLNLQGRRLDSRLVLLPLLVPHWVNSL